MHLHWQAQQASRDFRPQLLKFHIPEVRKVDLFHIMYGPVAAFVLLPGFLFVGHDERPLLRQIMVGDADRVTGMKQWAQCAGVHGTRDDE